MAAGYTDAKKRSGASSVQDWQYRFGSGGTLFGPEIDAKSPTMHNATATGASDWVYMRDSNLFVVQTVIVAGSFTAQIQGSIDNGANFISILPTNLTTGALHTGVDISVAGLFMVNAPMQFMRINVSAFGTGPIQFWFATIRGGGGR